MNDDGRIYLYYGWAIGTGSQKYAEKYVWLLNFICKHFVAGKMFEKSKEQMAREPQGIQGGNVVELADDMLTVISEPKRLAPGQFDAKEHSGKTMPFLRHHLCEK